LTIDDVRKFIEDYKEERLARFFKSAPIPDPVKEKVNHVKTVVGQTWQEIVEDPLMDVMVIFT